jgi:adenylate cyclase
VLIAESTKDALQSKTLLREIDRLRVKGKHEPVAIYEAMDHLTEEEFPSLTRGVELYAEGIRLYRERAFKDALDCFNETLRLNANDHPSMLYVERCAHFLQNPPEPDWDGVWVMTSK